MFSELAATPKSGAPYVACYACSAGQEEQSDGHWYTAEE